MNDSTRNPAPIVTFTTKPGTLATQTAAMMFARGGFAVTMSSDRAFAQLENETGRKAIVFIFKGTEGSFHSATIAIATPSTYTTRIPLDGSPSVWYSHESEDVELEGGPRRNNGMADALKLAQAATRMWARHQKRLAAIEAEKTVQVTEITCGVVPVINNTMTVGDDDGVSVCVRSDELSPARISLEPAGIEMTAQQARDIAELLEIATDELRSLRDEELRRSLTDHKLGSESAE